MKNQKKRIVIDARIRRSSTGRYVDRLIEHLQDIDKKNEYIILLQTDDMWQPKAVNFSVVRVPFPQFSLNPIGEIRFALKLYSLKADLVHFPMNQQPILYFKKSVTSTLDLTMLNFTRPGRTPLPIFWMKMTGYRFLFWLSNKRSEQIITISNYVRKELIKKYPSVKTKITTTHCASESPSIFKSITPTFIKPKASFILYVGTAFPHKNLYILVDAYKKLRKNNPDLIMVFAGKKEYHYEKIQKYVDKNNLSSSILIPGFVSDEELKWLYENALCYVFPSLSEGFGLPGLEAMAHGLPVVSSNATCLPEIYGDASIYFNPLNSFEMASKIEMVINDKKLRQNLIEKGKKQVQKYSWEKMAKETLAVYKKAF